MLIKTLLMKQLTFFLSLFLLSQISFAQTDKSLNLGKRSLAVQGYDVVSYFDGDAMKGSSEFSSSHQGAVYWFTSSDNKEKFDNSPETYIPQYGGWCAYAMGVDGSKVKIDPQTFKISDRKLYLFYNFRGNNTLIPWNEDEVSLRQKADRQWNKHKK